MPMLPDVRQLDSNPGERAVLQLVSAEGKNNTKGVNSQTDGQRSEMGVYRQVAENRSFELSTQSSCARYF